MKWILITLLSCICLNLNAQNIDAKLAAALKSVESDVQFKHAILSLYVVDTKTGKIVFDKNAQVGLAPASCQKVVTSVTAFEMLGKEYTYITGFTNYSDVSYKDLGEKIVVSASGDPSLGSWRWEATKPELLFKGLAAAFKNNINPDKLKLVIEQKNWSTNNIPGGWVWEDIGNYYGAGASVLNWRENQYDLFLKTSAEIGSKATVIKTEPKLFNFALLSEVTAAAKGTGDQAVIYLPEDAAGAIVRGTIPVAQNSFKISGAIPNATSQFNYEINSNVFCCFEREPFSGDNKNQKSMRPAFYQHHSPQLDSLNYWFLKKSINLYGEAFVKTIAYEKIKFGSTDSGIAIIKNFWKQKGIEPSALNIMDGSGLSPANRVTTNALVTVMQYAKQQKWFASFYNALPEMNGIKMKDGYISGVRSYTGYIKGKTGNEYTFSFIVNNFDGSPATVREKMWKVLDILK
jgi:serine-type D-Ala-D-Ala carboxypeptidase/endopeptidase (penicillin-binding protein 4)